MKKNAPLINNTILVKQTNIELVRKVIRKCHTATRSEIASATGLSVVTCGTILNEMVESNEIFIDRMEESSGGRPARRFKYNKDFIKVACIAISYDLSIKTLQYFIANAFGEIMETNKYTYEVLDFNVIDKIVKKIKSNYPDIKSLIISIPGESYNGIIQFCDINELQGIPLENELKLRYNINVFINGITQVAAYGYYISTPELYGKTIAVLLAPKDLHLGAGIIVNGQLIKGDKNLAGEVSFIGSDISREETLFRIPDKKFLISAMVTSLTAIISVINPTQIVIYGSAVSTEIYNQLLEKSKTIIPTVFMPDIKFIPNFDEYFQNGLVNLAIESTTQGLKLINSNY